MKVRALQFKAGLDDSGLPVTSKSPVLLLGFGQHCQGWGHFWDMALGTGLRDPWGAPWAHQSPLPVPSEVTRVSSTPTWVLSAGPLDRMAVSATSSGMASDPMAPLRQCHPWAPSLWPSPWELTSSLTGPSGRRPLSRTLGPEPARSPLAALFLLPARLLLPSLHPLAQGTLSQQCHGRV